ncbi:MAG: lipoyl(octanoyl) transferase LipB [Thermoguttaceae bacterium]
MNSVSRQDNTLLEAYLLQSIELERSIALQRKLVSEAAAWGSDKISVLLCEHPQIITVGRSGSPGHVQYDSQPIRSGTVQVRWVKRGGGCLVHGPGQLAVYPIVPLAQRGWTVGEYLRRFETAIGRALDALKIRCQIHPAGKGLWGRTGQLVAFGVSVSNWVTYHGAYINVSPSMGITRLVDGNPLGDGRVSTLVAERGQPVKMTGVRAEIVRHLADAFQCDRFHLHTGHPWLRRPQALVH